MFRCIRARTASQQLHLQVACLKQMLYALHCTCFSCCCWFCCCIQIVGSNEASILRAQEMINLLLDQLPPGGCVCGGGGRLHIYAFKPCKQAFGKRQRAQQREFPLWMRACVAVGVWVVDYTGLRAASAVQRPKKFWP